MKLNAPCWFKHLEDARDGRSPLLSGYGSRTLGLQPRPNKKEGEFCGNDLVAWPQVVAWAGRPRKPLFPQPGRVSRRH
jgi:hypothetical protein